MARAERMTDLVGRTPIVRLNRVTQGLSAKVWGKLEAFNPMSSVKDRIGLAMVEAAEREGELTPGATIVEATSGNTGIALAFAGAVKGYSVVIAMPDSMSIERRRLLYALGAEVILTPGEQGMRGATEAAERVVAERRNAVMMRQFENRANPEVHERTTAQEIIDDLETIPDVFVAGVGTGGTVTGVGRALKAHRDDVWVVAAEPDESPVLSGGVAGPHRIQGIGAGFVPPVYGREVVDEVVRVPSEEAGNTARRLAREEGILCGISAGANVAAALRLAAEPRFAGKTIVTVICDTGERYLSTWLFSGEDG